MNVPVADPGGVGVVSQARRTSAYDVWRAGDEGDVDVYPPRPQSSIRLASKQR